MASNAGLSVIVIDPAYTSRWSAVHWLPLLREQHPETTGHHAAALVIGRRGLGHRARTRVNGNRTAPADAMRPARTRTRKPPAARPSNRKPAAPRGQRQPPGDKTGPPHRTTAGNQAAQDRSGPPTGQYSLSRAVTTVPLTKVLHLKSAVTALPDGTVIGYRPLVDDESVFPAFLAVPEEGGAHVVVIDDETVLLSAHAPRTAAILRDRGLTVVTVDISEFEKLEGCVTCLSVRIRG